MRFSAQSPDGATILIRLTRGGLKMRYLVLTALVMAMSGALSAAEFKDTAAGLRADQKAALARFQPFLDGLGKRDKAGMMAQLLPGGSVVLMRKGKPVQMTLEALADRLSQP